MLSPSAKQSVQLESELIGQLKQVDNLKKTRTGKLFIFSSEESEIPEKTIMKTKSLRVEFWCSPALKLALLLLVAIVARQVECRFSGARSEASAFSGQFYAPGGFEASPAANFGRETGGSLGTGSVAAASASAATFAWPQQRTQSVSTPAAGQPKRARKEPKLDALFRRLLELEGEQSASLADCVNWTRLETRYIKSGGSTKQTRPNEQRKRAECDELRRFLESARNSLGGLGKLAADGSQPFAEMTEVVGEYLNLKRAVGSNQLLAREFERLRRKDRQVNLGAEQLEYFVELMREKLQADRLVGANGDQLGQLEAELKRLIDRENNLNEDESRSLLDLSDQLEEALVGGQVNMRSGRFRYLTGTLDAARAVVFRRLTDEAVGEQSKGAEQADERYAAEDGQSIAAATASAAAFGYDRTSTGSYEADNFAQNYYEDDDELGERDARQEPQQQQVAAPRPAPFRMPPMAQVQQVATAASTASASGGRASATAAALSGAQTSFERVQLPVKQPFQQEQEQQQKVEKQQAVRVAQRPQLATAAASASAIALNGPDSGRRPLRRFADHPAQRS